MKDLKKRLTEIYRMLYAHAGPQRWWPGDGPFEIIVGAILTQNTSWKNVEKAIASLKDRRLLFPAAMRRLPVQRLAALIRPSGYYNVKARRLKSFLDFLFSRYGGSLKRMFARPTDALREELLSVNGIGRETADSILLYAGGHTTFVVDLYTWRVLTRHALVPEAAGYETMRALFMTRLPPDPSFYNEFHALFVHVGHHFCRRTARCEACPLKPLLPGAQTLGKP